MNFQELYKKYSSELFELSKITYEISHSMQRKGYCVGFGDFEGEIAYMLIREQKPNLVYEISPAAGYSSNYLLAALSKNDFGELHSFELLHKIYGRNTEEVIRSNISKKFNHEQHKIFLGDVTEREFEHFPDFLLIDSCHEKFFAEWYLENLVPRVSGLVMMQDICFADRLEKTSEAEHVWSWLLDNNIPNIRLGIIERNIYHMDERSALLKRRPLESNSVLVGKNLEMQFCTDFSFLEKPEDFIDRAKTTTSRDAALCELLKAEELISKNKLRGLRHRIYLQIAFSYKKLGLGNNHCLRNLYKSLAEALNQGANTRSKALREIFKSTKRIHFLLRFLSSKNQRKHTPVIRAFTFTLTVFFVAGIDRVFNWKSWRRHT